MKFLQHTRMLRWDEQDLDMLWESESANWAGAGEAAMQQAEPVYQQTPELSPEQLRLISAHFDKVSHFPLSHNSP